MTASVQNLQGSSVVDGRQPKLRFDPIAEGVRQWEAHGWEEAAPGVAAVTSIMRVQQILYARIDEVLRPFEVSYAGYEFLMLLSFTRLGQLPLGKIGDRLQIHPASVTHAVKQLESRNLVRREAHRTDGRTKLAVIQPAGRRIAAKATEALNARVFTALDWSPQDLTQLWELLRKLRQAAGDFPVEAP